MIEESLGYKLYTANNWWLRSANSNNDTNFRNVNNNGNVNNNNANNTNGVALGFSQGRQSNHMAKSVHEEKEFITLPYG